MNVTEHNKLVRDKIPDIIKNQGGLPHVRILNEIEFGIELIRKLHEETKEFDESHEIEELADIFEVVYSIADLYGYKIEEIIDAMVAKREKNGGFRSRIFLTTVER